MFYLGALQSQLRAAAGKTNVVLAKTSQAWRLVPSLQMYHSCAN
jgi:hypothetical protein